ncbi:MAG: tetratricopeptide repeat protein [Fibrobacterota bacterium]
MRFVVPILQITCLAAVFWGCRDPNLDRGRAFLQLEDWPRSVASYDACVQSDPENAEARLGLALSRLGQVRERAQVGADSLEDWMRVARDLSIVERLDSTQSTRDERADALFHASLWLHKRGRAAQAERLARQAQQADPGQTASAQFLGNLARARGDLAEAERWYSRALAADSAYLPAYIGLGEMALADNDPEGAVVYWQMGSKRDPGNPWLKASVARLVDSMGLKGVR